MLFCAPWSFLIAISYVIFPGLSTGEEAQFCSHAHLRYRKVYVRAVQDCCRVESVAPNVSLPITTKYSLDISANPSTVLLASPKLVAPISYQLHAPLRPNNVPVLELHNPSVSASLKELRDLAQMAPKATG